MKIKSLALVAAAAVVSAGAAQAADLNRPAKVAVDYVKVCDAYGAGFFYIPGSDTCLQISGYARYTIATGAGRNIFDPAVVPVIRATGNPSYLGFGSNRASNSFATGVETELDFDARTNTAYGLLRSYISIENDFGSGANGANGGTTVNMNRGYLQWGGLTAGRIESNFTFFQGFNDELVFSELAPDYQVNALSYTFAFGNGVTATIGLEDSTTYGGRNGGATFAYQGNKTPDIVANLNVTQAWGSAQISAAAHQVYGTGQGGVGPAINVSRFGYALLAGVWFNLPTLGAGDKIGLQGVYAQGALRYTSAGEIPGFAGTDLGADASVVNGSSKLGTSWNIYGGYVHNFTPTVSLAIGGGYQGQKNSAGFNGDSINYNLGAVGATLGWTPVKGLAIDFNLEYENVSFNSATKADYALRNGDSWLAGLRIKRSF